MIEQAAAKLAAAEIEAAIEQAAACAVREAELVAIQLAVEEMVAAVTTTEAKRLRLAQAWARKIARTAATWTARAFNRTHESSMHTSCFICMDLEIPTDAYMPCRRHHVHRTCILTWHGMGWNETNNQIPAPKQGGGWTAVDMARLHQCLHCSADMLSARLPMF